jgi:hypothetical protein
MSQNKILTLQESEFFFTVEYSKSRFELCINMTLQGIDMFLNCLNKFSKITPVVITSDNITKDTPIENYISVPEILIQYESIETEDLAINYSDNDHRLYIFASEKGIHELIDSLMCLKEGLEEDKPEDISYMIEEWGGDYLLNKKIIENSDIICHLRLYGILG